MKSKGKTILAAEVDQNDVFFLQYAFEVAGIQNPIQFVCDGQQAINYLAGIGEYADRERFPYPVLLLLDLKMPVKMGMDVLGWIKEQGHLAHLAVIMLTSSADINDVDRAYSLGANSYIVKPVSLARRIEIARIIKHYWLELNEFPSLAASPGPVAKPRQVAGKSTSRR